MKHSTAMLYTMFRKITTRILFTFALLLTAVGAKAADYIFTYNGGYLAVNNSGAIIYTTTLSPQCVWTCVSSTTNLTASTLSTTSRFLYTTDGNGTRRWLVGSTTDGAAITTTTTAPGTARWRNNNNRLYYRDGNDYYAYYRDNTWRTSRRNNGTTYGVNAYMSGNNTGTDYRSTTYQVTVSTVTSTFSNPSINGADVLTATGNSTYTATGAAYRIGYTNYNFNNANHYVDANGNSFTGTPANATLTNTWTLEDNSNTTVNSTSGVVTVSSLPQSDLTLMLTLTVAVSGGTPAAPAGTTLTASKEITIQGTTPSAPIINVSGTSVTLTTEASGTTSIRYTLDGTDPTATTGTVYNGTIDLSSSATSPVTIKAVTVRNGNASAVTTQQVTLPLPEPVITVDGSSGAATITSSVAGATIYYTTDGSTPTTSSSQYSGSLSGLTMMTTIKAIAVKDGWNNSPVASETVTIPSGTGGGVVTLFDYEPHSWSYYSDSECPVRSLNPADVKITYYGDGIVMTGNNDYTASSTDFVQPGNSNYVGGAKVNVGGENENTFIYYKTLERGANTQTAWTFSSGNQSTAASRCPYTPIPNPFQVRPTYGSRNVDANDFTGWRGFQCWRLKSVTGGAVYNAASGGTALAVNAIVNAETEIYFAPNSEYGMEVELEAVWARAYLIKGNQGGENAILNYGNLGVERNFMTLTDSENYRFNGTTGRRITNVNRAVTISCYYPSGEAPDNTGGVVSGNNNDITLGADTKFENVTLNVGGNYVTANGYDLIIGRGCTSTVGTVRGLSGNTTGAIEYTIRLEHGTFNTFNMIDGTTRTHSGTVSAKTIFGCDYDRAKGDNEKLSISANSTVYGASSYQAFTGGGNRNNLTYDWLIKSGKVQATKGVADGAAANCIYMGNTGNGNDSDGNRYQGKRRLIMEGGEVCNISGGLNNYGNNWANYVVNEGWAVQIRMKGGTVRGSIFGAAAFAGASGDRLFIFTGGTIGGWVAGGANGTQNSGGELYGSTSLYIGGKTVIGSESGGTHVGGTSTYGTNGADGGNVFGAGCGILPANGNYQTGTVGRVDNSVVAVADEATIWRDVYGGGNYGWVRDNGTTGIYILGGTVNGSVFGGSNNQQGQEVAITMKGGIIKGNTIGDATKTGGLYGGSNSWGTINDNVTMNINGGQVGTSSKPANIHGGGYGQPTRVSGNVEITLGTTTQTTPGVTVYGDVYGGSALGYVNGEAATSTYHTNVTMNKGTINGSLYGGGLGDGSNAANVYGPVAVKVYGGKVNTTAVSGSGAVYGCNNINGAPQRAVTVDIYGTDPAPSANAYALDAVYGGGNQADYSYGTPTVTVHNCDNSIGYVYGGGNAAHITNGNTDVTIYGGNKIGNVFGGGNGTVTAANVSGDTNVKIYGGTIGKVFGGSNSRGNIGGTINVTVVKQAGDTDPDGSSTACAMHIDEVYGGGNMAASNAGNISIGCTGGSNEGIGDVYGGANAAAVNNNIALTITGGSIERVFGGNNTSGAISGTIKVDVNWNTTNPCGYNYLGSVFGGGNHAAYSGTPDVNIINGTVNHCVYGGGNEAGVAGGDVSMTGGTVLEGIYGGCNTSGTVTGNIAVSITGGTVGTDATHTANVHGGGYGASTDTNGNVAVAINGSGVIIWGDVYGGSALGNVNGSSSTTTVTLTDGTIHGNLYGGGLGDASNAALVNGSVTVAVNGGSVTGAVFGCNNVNGTPKGAVSVTINGTAATQTVNGNKVYALSAVYGGGNLAHYDPTDATASYPTVTVNDCATSIKDVYGGGNAAAVPRTNVIINGGDIDRVFAGGNGESGTPANVGYKNTNANPSSDSYGAGTANAQIKGGTINKIFGGSNANGTIRASGQLTVAKPTSGSNLCDMKIGEVYGGGNEAAGAASAISIGCTGTGNDEGITTVYGGANAANVTGNITLTIEEGKIANVFGGNNTNGSISGTIAVNINKKANPCVWYVGYVFGGGNVAAYAGSPTVTLTNGEVSHSVYGGGNEAGVGGSTVNINGGSVIDGVYGGCNTSGNVSGDIVVNINGGTLGTSSARLTSGIFGGGYGVNTTTSGSVTVNVGDANAASAAATSTIYGDIYGGSALGTVNDAVADVTTVNFNNGTLHGNIYGGGLGAATLNSDGYIASVTTQAIVNGTVHVNIGTSSQSSNFVTIDGQIFGCNNLAGTPKGPVYVDVYKTAHTAANTYPSPAPSSAADVTVQASTAFAIGAVYGGGNLAHYTTTESGASTHVTIHGCDNTIEYVYGGGNAANSPATEVIIEGGRFNYIFGGGNGAGTGNPGANIAGNAVATLYGGIVYRAFGGSNTKGTIGGLSQVNLPDDVPTGMSTCTRLVHEIFGGGNEAPGGNVDMVIPCGTTGTGIVYAGANNADMGTETDFNNGRPVLIKLTVEGGNFTQVFGGNNQGGTIWGNVELYLKGGTIVDAFGGNNLGGNIKGTIKVFVVDAESTTCPLVLTNVYGGGYNAPYTPALNSSGETIESPLVYVNHLKSGNKILGSVYGGGYGTPATVTANPIVTIGDVETGHESKIATIAGNVYGGGNAASVVGSTSVLIQKSNTVIEGRVFGAGKGSDSDAEVASVSKNATVQMTGGWVETNIYGGGEMASVGTYTRNAQGVITGVTTGTGTTTVTFSGGTVGPNNLNPTNIDGQGNVFGGGLGKAGSDYFNFAYVNTSYVNVTNGTIRGSVFGGGENGHVRGDTHVTIGGGEVGVRVIYEYRNIHSDNGSSKALYAGNVYGGGRGVDHTAVGNHLSETAGRVYGNTFVNVTGGHIRHAVYGGGSLASVGTYTLTADNRVFGGHIHNFTSGTGDATVNISGGRIGPSWDDLYYNKAGDHLVDASGVPVNTAARDTIAKYFECIGENEGMVYGSGRGMNYPNDNNTDHQLYVEMAFTNNTSVTISGDNTEIIGSVFGGGENGHVKGDTQVNIQGGTIGGFRLHHNGFYLPGHMGESAYFIEDNDEGDDEMSIDVNGTGKVIFRGNVYGGGRGVDHIAASDPTQAQQIYSISAGRVYGNTNVLVTGGHVLHNVFGGGSIASVGTYNYPVEGGTPQFLNENPSSCWDDTGTATVTINGGMVGQMGENEGYVYGGCRGVAGGRNAQVTHLAYVNETYVNIGTDTGTHADVRASVFGGGMNGHVLTNTNVTISGGVIGGKTDEDYGTYDTERYPLTGTVTYNGESVYIGKPTKVDYTIDGVNYYSGIYARDTITSTGGIGPATVFLGNAYGGGRGVDHFGANNDDLSLTAGRIYGNANLTVTGGVIYHSIFGGGSIASVGTYTTYSAAEIATDEAADDRYRISDGQPKECVSGTGTATVTVTGGRIGTNGRNNGRVFGSSRGMAGENYRGLGYVNSAIVTIGTSGAQTGPEVRGSVFGSGENGHVLTSTQVNIESGHIGNGKETGTRAWLNHYIGNVYGGGRGVDRDYHDGVTVSPFAGRVYGTTTVNVRGGQIDHNVYGGGSLASVGRYKRYMADNTSEKYNTITYADAGVGICRVNVSGGTIGIDGDNNGHVFGSSRGTAAGNRDILSSLAYVADTRVTISGGVVKGSVFGGGESGHVQRDAKVTISGGTIGSAIPKDYAACTAAEKEMYDLMGNVYGAGRGVDTYDAGSEGDQYSFSAGYVRGNTEVEITGGTIHRNVYGGGSMGIVGDYGPHGLNDFFEGNPATNGLAKVTIKGAVGTAADVAHGYGGNVFGSSRGKANDPSDPDHDFAEMSYSFQTQVNVDTGADVFGNVYGGGENGHVDYAGTTVTIKNGRVRGNVFGGGKGNISSATAGIIDGPTRVFIGTPDQSSNTVQIDGDVFAGNDTHSSPLGEMRVDVYCIKSGTTLNNVYGGGNLANVLTGVAANDVTSGYSVFNIDYITQRIDQTDSETPASFKPWPGGTSRKSIVYVHTGNHAIGSVFGGGKMADCKLTEVTIDGGVTTDVYGGGEQGEVRETTRVDLVSGTVTNVYGGGLGKKNGFFGSTEDVAADVGGNVIVNLNGGSSVASPLNNCVVKGSIFGCNNLNGTPKGHVTVHVYRTQGWTGHDVSAGKADATIEKGTGVYEVAAVYGGGNMAAYVPTSATEATDVIIDGCDLTSIEYVYGGGNAASVPNAQVTVNGTYEIGTVFGGGNGKDNLPNGAPNPGAHVGFLADGTTTYANNAAGNVDVYLYGGTIHNAFGGSNTLGNIRGKSEQHINEVKDGSGNAVCPLLIDEVYGGGNVAYMAGGTDLDLGCVTYLKAIYGGAKNANVGGDINLTITSGHFDRVFGGNNIGGVISGSITVNIEETGCNPITIGELYGCGNQARYTTPGNKHPTINVKSFTSIGRIFGGGLGASAVVRGNPTVNINEVVGEKASFSPWNYPGTTINYDDGTSVTLPTHTAGEIGAIGTVFGGGNAARVEGDTNVYIGTLETISYTTDAVGTNRTVVGVKILDNVFGGGNKADVTGSTNVVIGREATTTP